MSDEHWKLKKSRIQDVVPVARQIDDDTLAYNQRDGKLYAIKFEENGERSVIQIGGDSHPRKHNIISLDDHIIEAQKGQILVTDSESSIKFFTVEAETISGVGNQISLQYDFPASKIIIGLDETKVNHNNLMNYEADRHREMNYDEQIKAYLIND